VASRLTVPTPNSRHQARRIALQTLYRFDDEALLALDAPAFAQELVRHFEHFQVEPGVREFAAQLVSGTLISREKLDALILKTAQNWRLERMPVIDRNLLRLATYELTATRDIPVAVVINEAVELAKEYGTQDTPAFVNGILDALSETLNSAETAPAGLTLSLATAPGTSLGVGLPVGENSAADAPSGA
jgi:transcription antitermination protein NusB